MQYRKLGNTDIDVSLIAMGTMTYGEQNTQDEAFEQLDYAYEQGINFYDVAEMYSIPPREETFGASELIVGNWLKSRGLRDKIVLATKVAGRGNRNRGIGYIRGGSRLNAEHIKMAVEGSLKRLQTDHIDLYQVHWPERATNFFGRLGYEHKEEEDNISIEETLSALNDLVKDGKIRHIGLSNETPWGVMEYTRLSYQSDMPRIMSVQNPYNLLNRTYEIGLAEISIREQMGLLAYSPLAFGVLSGKYLNGAKPENTRLTIYDRFGRYNNPYAEAATQAYADLAKASGLSLIELSMAFIHQQAFLTSNIIGATTMAQLKENIATADTLLSQDVLEAINTIHHQYCNPAP